MRTWKASEGGRLFHCCSDLMLDIELQENILKYKRDNPRGTQTDMFSVTPTRYFSKSIDGRFLQARSGRRLRQVYGWTYKVIKDLTEIGFEYSREERFYYVLINKDTGVRIITSSEKSNGEAEFQYLDDFNPSQGKAKIKIYHNSIIGAGVEKHKEGIAIKSAICIAQIANGHSVQHKKHSNAFVFLDEEGIEITAQEYANKHSISRQWALIKLKKLNSKEIT